MYTNNANVDLRIPKIIAEELSKEKVASVSDNDCNIVNRIGELIREIDVKTDLSKLTLDGLKVFLSVCAHITNNIDEYKELIEEKYKDCNNEEIIKRIMEDDVLLEISFGEIVDVIYKDKRYNSDTLPKALRQRTEDKLKDITTEIQSVIFVNDKKNTIINWG